MKIKKMRRMIREQLRGGGNFTEAVFAANEAQKYAQDAIQAGRNTDADAIVMFVVVDGTIIIALFAGRSILLGQGIKEYLSDYHDNVVEHTDHCIEWLTDSAVDTLKNEDNFFAVLCDNESERWRGFRGEKPMTIDEIQAQAKKAEID